jgi:NAD-dependent deacetylase
MNPNKIVVFTGAGISAESGLQTFRDSDGLWYQHSIEDVATRMGWARDPERVLQFYNDRRKQVFEAQPNAAHTAVARLEKRYEVVVITQNIDDLHERAGSTQVIHVHGQINVARSTDNESLLYPWDGGKRIEFGDVCELGSQLRPHVVWFGEDILHHDVALAHMTSAAKVLVVGTSLSVYPVAGFVKKAPFSAQKTIVTQALDDLPHGYKLLRGKATELVPGVVNDWLQQSQG